MPINHKIKKKKNHSISDCRITLDAQHKLKMNEMETMELELPTMKKELIELIENKNELLESCLGFGLIETKTGREIYLLNNKILNLKKKIKNVETGKLKDDYFSKTAHILCDYYDNIKRVSQRHTSESANLLNTHKANSSRKISDYVNTPEKSNRANLLEEYTKAVNPKFYHPVNHYIKTEIDICNQCDIEMSLIQSEGLVVCPQCGREEPIIIDSEKPSYKDPPPEAGEFTYKRINRFDEWLTQYQAKETTEIPQEVLDKILLEMKKEGIKNMARLTMEKVRGYLKKLGMNKYYEHIPHIIYCLNGLPTPRLSQETEEKLRSMFRQIQDIFDQVCPSNRTNFLSYSYLLRKLLELLGEDEHVSYFRLHKSREKIYQHDKIWQKICKKLKWQFIRTI
jgi:predicted RNA-binding Zn-ribbon protein involved in translation (DUF1610 family)